MSGSERRGVGVFAVVVERDDAGVSRMEVMSSVGRRCSMVVVTELTSCPVNVTKSRKESRQVEGVEAGRAVQEDTGYPSHTDQTRSRNHAIITQFDRPPATAKERERDSDPMARLEGSVAGMAQVAVGHPLDTVKVRLQLAPPNTFRGPLDVLKTTITQEGILGLYKGMASPLVGVGFVNAYLFAAYGWFKKIQTPLPASPTSSSRKGVVEGELKIRQVAAAGAAAGASQAWLSSPIELIKIRLQNTYSQPSTSTGKHIGPIEVTMQLLKQHGLRGLFHGTWSTVVREIPAYAGFYGGFEYTKRLLRNPRNPEAPLPVSKLMVAGGVGGVMYWTCCYPLDVAKTRIQQLNPGEGSTAVIPTLRAIYKDHGIPGFFRGYVTSVIRSLPAAGATFTGYELTMRLLG
ncbi:hypothetical protein HDV05_004753 [Chytridiales sp. JEL 0842]|nr:hypothetical protein HDV05_004753 [Chytridiales sp. JEL 0842]